MPESLVQVTEGSGKKLHTISRTIGANTVEDEVIIVGEPFLAAGSATNLGGTTVSAATANSHLIQLMAPAGLNVYVRRIRLYQIGLATTAAIAELAVFRLTTAGTGGTALTPEPLDTTDTMTATAMTLPSSKGTEGARPIWHGTTQFIQTVGTGGAGPNPLLADIEFDTLKLKSLRIPAGTANGIALKNITAVAGATCIVLVEFTEANY